MIEGQPPRKTIRRRVHKGRVIGCAAVLVGIIILFVLLVQKCSDDKPVIPVVAPPEVTTAVTKAPEEKKLIICLDAGHGGDDAGAVYKKRNEKDDNLELTLKVKNYLKNSGIEVITTRDDDVYISLDDRSIIANTAKADLFVSIHRNSASAGNGVEVWIEKSKPLVDSALAKNILEQLKLVGVSSDRGVSSGFRDNPEGNYAVNSDTDMPSCLVEMGFITNIEDNQLFDKNIDAYAEAIGKGILKTANDYIDK